MYKIQTYHLFGANKGNRKGQIIVNTMDEVKAIYSAYFEPELYSLNPTVWQWCDEWSDWKRIQGF